MHNNRGGLENNINSNRVTRIYRIGPNKNVTKVLARRLEWPVSSDGRTKMAFLPGGRQKKIINVPTKIWHGVENLEKWTT